MRRSERNTKPCDYKVLSTIGTTKQDKKPLFKQDCENQGSCCDETTSAVHQDVEKTAANIEVSALFAKDSDENISSDNEETVHVDEENITNTPHIADGDSNLNVDQQTSALSDIVNVIVNTDVNVTEHSNQPSSSNQNLPTSSSPTMEQQQLTVDEATVAENIADFFDENEICDVGDDPSDYESLTKQAEEYRSTYRSIHIQLSTVMETTAYEEKFKDKCSTTCEAIKKYIKTLKVQ